MKRNLYLKRRFQWLVRELKPIEFYFTNQSVAHLN